MGEAKRRGTKEQRIEQAIREKRPSYFNHRGRGEQMPRKFTSFSLPLLWAAMIGGLQLAKVKRLTGQAKRLVAATEISTKA